MEKNIKTALKNFIKIHKDSIKHYNQVTVKFIDNSLESYQNRVNKILDKYGN